MLKVHPLTFRNWPRLSRLLGDTGNPKANLFSWTLRADRAFLVAQRDSHAVGWIKIRIAGRGRPASHKRLRRLLRWAQVLLTPKPDDIILPMRIGHIERLEVLLPVQEQDIAQKLVEAAVDWLRERGACQIHVLLRVDDERLQRLYGNLGFEPARLLMDGRVS
jgi:ribosomal protein S18 acetylase RimI-like enzyme